ncbi:PTS sugar transporter subunit IIB [Paenibacillus polymyxa]|uniref:PTS sugar transporter subunit IIB n=1 Tax=Paenibacillus polymyxa TaxID=1406 RepID=UPI0025B7149B|nr:PTS sugar transporter subunit IIB [Paenibacillus polymyxa]MDN4084532.1 PTS sugar transporter subunit IIB [Paenibacillus polymyxa]MDN4090163.1 PTS sugar transporter subunit IIB [Paenibacillus polymyxa]MDN4110834.1 PTS sugar transporter subunit IIB [Paenibacillus polymyxa]
MEKMKILLCCGAGMSSGFMAQKARAAAKKRGIEVSIDAKSEAEAASLLSTVDVLLLGPHYASHKEKFSEIAKQYNVPVEVIPQKIYGMLDGDKLLNFAIQIVQNDAEI